MKFYDRVLRELRDGAHTFETIHRLAFGFGNEVFFEYSADIRVFSVTYDACSKAVRRAAASLVGGFPISPRRVVALRLRIPGVVTLFWALLWRLPALLLSRTAAGAVRTGSRAGRAKSSAQRRAGGGNPRS